MSHEEEPRQRPLIPLPKETFEDTDVMLAAERQQRQWVDEAYEDFVKKGGLESLAGYGKPLEVPTGDILTTLLKQANVPPPFIMLRREIQANTVEALKLLEREPESPKLGELMEDINRQIAELNHQAPSLSLHRKKVNRANLREQYERWK
ncbi:DUF1992 domain-containing protein [Paenibacillus sp. GD4]|uniref:DUF1992 domain-containing protein n=1 Tax=Paenibacillus sp. GD4 TaxID=3068890 RepID=UPI0027966277|nr:DUF1992 domain-containing protein [Paenibacillus sp. GD4]MDQ1911483.1 DUF1992 domain-containing protein [Paenibacillus sp. GD4]